MRLAPVGGEYVIQRINLYNSEVLPREVSMISDGSSYNFVKESRDLVVRGKASNPQLNT